MKALSNWQLQLLQAQIESTAGLNQLFSVETLQIFTRDSS